MRIAVALGAPTVARTRAMIAGWRQPPRCAASIVSPMSQPRAAHGSSMSEVRET